MLELNSNHWLIKTYEFLSGNYMDYEKPKSLCGLFWNILLVIATSPFTAFIGLLGLKSQKIKHLTFKERLSRVAGFLFLYFIVLIATIGHIQHNYGIEYLISINPFLLFIVYPLTTALSITAGVLVFAFIAGGSIEGTKYLAGSIKSKLVESGALDKESKIQFIKGKICPRIKWKG